MSSYLLGTTHEGLLFERGHEGKSVLNTEENIFEWDDDEEESVGGGL